MSVTVLAVYYVLNSSVYQSPTIYSLVNERLVRTLPVIQEEHERTVSD